MRTNALIYAALMVMAALPAAAREAPAAHCIDSRAIAGAHQVDAHTLVMRGADGGRHVMTLGEACPGVLAEADTQLLAADGWSCGLPGEVIRTASQSCPITETRAIDSRAYAAFVQQAQDGVETLDAVAVQGKRVRGFAGTSDYCVRTRGLRSWQDGVGGVTVEVPPRRSGANRYYRIETVGRCGEAANADSLELVSGLENGMVCGHPGDRAVFRKLYDGADPMETRGVTAMQAFLQSGLAARTGCQITRVYPVEG